MKTTSGNTKRVRILTGAPTVVALAEMALMPKGLDALASWVQENVPEAEVTSAADLFPRHGITEERQPTDNELIAELAGRKCYNSFGHKGVPRSNADYLKSMWEGRIPHRSTGYHPHMMFFIAGVSRRLSHEMFRNYIGHAKEEEGEPSQESTRYTDHPGSYIAHPFDLHDPAEMAIYEREMQEGYDRYLQYQERRIEAFAARNDGRPPKGIDRKRIYESASGRLHHSCSTSFIWTSNPMAIGKMLEERVDSAADLEYQRLARTWRDVCLQHWPNDFVTLSENARS